MHVDGQGAQRRDVQHLGARPGAGTRLGGPVGRVDGDEEPGERLARAGGRGHQHVAARRDVGPGRGLGWRRARPGSAGRTSRRRRGGRATRARRRAPSSFHQEVVTATNAGPARDRSGRGAGGGPSRRSWAAGPGRASPRPRWPGAGRSRPRWRSRGRGAGPGSRLIVAISSWLQAGSLTGKDASAATPTQARRPEPARQGAAVGQVDPTLGQQGAEAPAQAVGQHLLGSAVSSRQLSGWSAGSASSTRSTPPGRRAADHVGQGGVTLGHVHQDEAGVDQVEGPRGGGSAATSCSRISTLGAAGAPAAQERLMSVASDLPARADPLGQMGHHRRPARPHLPAAPTRGQPEAVEVPEGRGVEQGGEGGEAVHRLGGVVGEEVAVPGHGAAVGRGRQVVRGPDVAVEHVGHLGPPLLDQGGRGGEVAVLARGLAATAEDDHLDARRQQRRARGRSGRGWRRRRRSAPPRPGGVAGAGGSAAARRAGRRCGRTRPSRARLIGTLLTTPPSTSTSPSMVTGGKMDGMAEEARMASTAGPWLIQRSRPSVSDVVTTSIGMVASSRFS